MKKLFVTLALLCAFIPTWAQFNYPTAAPMWFYLARIANPTMDTTTYNAAAFPGILQFRQQLDDTAYWVSNGRRYVKVATGNIDLSNYYTKTELQTAGQSQVYFGNITAVPRAEANGEVAGIATFNGNDFNDDGLGAISIDYTNGPDARYPQLSGSYSNPSWLTSLPWSKITSAPLGTANGIATLDASGKVPMTQIPEALLGAVIYQGTYNAATNTPALPSASGSNKGWYYVVSAAGTQQSLTLNPGDWVISNGSGWGKVDNNNAVTSVFGRTGAVTAQSGDYSTTQVTEGTNLYYTNARARAAVGASSPLNYNGTTGVFGLSTVPVANGGTGLTSMGTANQLLRVNSSATGLEYFTPTYISGNQSITLSGDVTGTGTTTIATALSNLGTAGTYTKVTTDSKGRVTSGTTLAAADIPTITASKISDFTATARTSLSAGTGISYNNSTGVISSTVANYWTASGNNIYNNNISNVGIGTTNPIYSLHSASNSTTAIMAQHTGTLGTNSGSFLSTAATGLPSLADQRLGAFTFGSFTTGSTYRVGAQIEADAEGAWTEGSSYPSSLRFLTVQSGSSGPFERMRITPTGFVGIGTTTPATRLDVNGAITAGSLYSPSGSSLILWGQGATADINFAAGSTSATKMILDASGNVGIGTTNPIEMLDVAGSGNFDGYLNVGGGTATITGLGNATFTALNVSGNVVLSANSPAAGKVLTATDGAGNTAWRTTSQLPNFGTIVTGSYTVDADDNAVIVNATGAASTVNIALPAATGANSGRIVNIYKISTNGQAFQIGGTTLTQTVFAVMSNGTTWTTIPLQ